MLPSSSLVSDATFSNVAVLAERPAAFELSHTFGQRGGVGGGHRGINLRLGNLGHEVGFNVDVFVVLFAGNLETALEFRLGQHAILLEYRHHGGRLHLRQRIDCGLEVGQVRASPLQHATP